MLISLLSQPVAKVSEVARRGSAFLNTGMVILTGVYV